MIIWEYNAIYKLFQISKTALKHLLALCNLASLPCKFLQVMWLTGLKETDLKSEGRDFIDMLRICPF